MEDYDLKIFDVIAVLSEYIFKRFFFVYYLYSKKYFRARYFVSFN